MSTLMIRRSAFLNLTDKQERLIRIIPERISLGAGVEYIQPPNTHWFLWDDYRFRYRDIAMLAVFTRMRNQAESAVVEDENVRDTLRNWLETRSDFTEPPPEEEDRFQWILDQNNAPPGIRFSWGVPQNWNPA